MRARNNGHKARTQVVEIEDWLVYALKSGTGYFTLSSRIVLFRSTNRAKAFRSAHPELAGHRLEPVLLNTAREAAARHNLGVVIDPEPQAARIPSEEVVGEPTA